VAGLEDTIRSPVADGNIGKPLMLAQLALLAKRRSKKQNRVHFMIPEGVITNDAAANYSKCTSEQRNAKYHFPNLLCTDYNRS